MSRLRMPTAIRAPRLVGWVSGISLLISVGAVVAALATTILLLVLSGADPSKALRAILDGSLSSGYALSVTVSKTVPRLLAALGIALALRAGLYNIGAQGQIYVGGIAAAAVGVMGPWTGAGALVLALVAAAAAGALWGAIPGVLRVRRRVSEVITSLMLVYVAIGLTNYLLQGPWRVEGATFPATAPVPPATALPVLATGTLLNLGAIIALLAVPIVAFLMRRTVFGFQLSAIGGSTTAARAAGMNVGRTVIAVMAVSGAFAGLAGAIEVVGVNGDLSAGFAANYGFDAIAIALLGRLNPVGVLAAALLFGVLDAGATGLQTTSGAALPAGIVPTVEGLALFYVLIALGAGRMIERRRRARSLLASSGAAQTRGAAVDGGQRTVTADG